MDDKDKAEMKLEALRALLANYQWSARIAESLRQETLQEILIHRRKTGL